MAWNTLKNYLTGSGGVTANAGTASTALGTIAAGSDVLTTNFSGVKSTVDSLSLMASELAGGPYTVWKDSGVPSSVTSGAVSGQLYFDSATNKLYQYSSAGAWVEIGDLDNPGGVADVVKSYVRVTPSAQIYVPTTLTSYTSNTVVTFQSSGSSPYYWDTDGMTTVANTITIKTAGLYNVSFNGGAGGLATMTQIEPYIYIDGTPTYTLTTGIVPANNGGYFSLSKIVPLTVGQTITARVGITGGSAYTIYGTSGSTYGTTSLNATWIGATS